MKEEALKQKMAGMALRNGLKRKQKTNRRKYKVIRPHQYQEAHQYKENK